MAAALWRRLTGPTSNEGFAARYARRPEVVAGCEQATMIDTRYRKCEPPARRRMAGHEYFDVSTMSRSGSRCAKRSR